VTESSDVPSDVVATMDWLIDSGFELIQETGGHDAPFGDQQFVYADERLWRVSITRDRSQWSLSVELPHWPASYDLGRLVEVRPPIPPGSLPSQLPFGVSWRSTLPGVLERLGAESAEE